MATGPFSVRRLGGNPLVHRESAVGVGKNINGPSLILAPPWVEEPLGRYYLYFAHHRGSFIRLATADRLEGPWRIYQPGTLQLAESHFPTDGRRPHIASPDVHLDPASGTVRMYFHGLDTTTQVQHTRVALSTDGVHFVARPEVLGRPYFRVFLHQGWWYALAMPGILYRSLDGLDDFERGPRLFEPTMRHSALLKRDDQLLVFWSRVGDCPEHILCSPITLHGDWTTWRAGPATDVLEPQASWEGADGPFEPSVRGWVDEPVRQLRDPAIFQEEDRTYLLYSVAGESGIAIAELESANGATPLAAGAGWWRRLANRVAGTDHGLVRAREGTVTMAATLASFAAALLIERTAGLSVSVVILAVALALSVGRTEQRPRHVTGLTRALAVVVVPLVALAANEIGTRMFQQPNLGDILFVLGVGATIWARRFGPLAGQIATLATLPLVAMLVVPAPPMGAPGAAGSRWWTALIAVVAVVSVTLTRQVAERAGFLPPPAGQAAPPDPPGGTPTRAGRRLAPSTKLAIQMGAALGAAFVVGRAAFGPHWTWVVLTAFIVCSGNRGRGDVLHKATMRLAGAGTGTLVATAIASAFPAGDPWAIVAIFAVLAVALWLRPLNYAYWAAGMTAALALLYAYYGERGPGLLGTRLEAILAGAALGVAASWLLLPVRTTDVLRRDIGRALVALDRWVVALADDPGSLPERQAGLTHAVAALEHADRLLRSVPRRLRAGGDQRLVIAALDRCADTLPLATTTASGNPSPIPPDSLDALRTEIARLRRANGQRRPPDGCAWDHLVEAVAALAQPGSATGAAQPSKRQRVAPLGSAVLTPTTARYRNR